jgi:hypothetical protein
VAKPCLLSGTNMFLALSLSATPGFENPVEIAPDFTGTQVVIPHPASGVIYLKLRDDPATVQTLTMPITPAAPGSLDGLATAKAQSATPPEAPSAQSPNPAASAEQPPSAPKAAMPPATGASAQ